jgi:hypothetical protein
LANWGGLVPPRVRAECVASDPEEMSDSMQYRKFDILIDP